MTQSATYTVIAENGISGNGNPQALEANSDNSDEATGAGVFLGSNSTRTSVIGNRIGVEDNPPPDRGSTRAIPNLGPGVMVRSPADLPYRLDA